MCRLSLCQLVIPALAGTWSHLSGLKWQGSEWSRGGCGSRGRCNAESSSEELHRFRECPGRVEEEGAEEAEEGSRERLSGGL